MTKSECNALLVGSKLLHDEDNVNTVYAVSEISEYTVSIIEPHRHITKIVSKTELRKHYTLLKPITVGFNRQFQQWHDKDGKLTVDRYLYMSTDNVASCRLSYYKDESVAILSDVYVDYAKRGRGYCNAMLDMVDKECLRQHILVYVDSYAPQFVRDMYRKRGYLIMNSGE